LLNKIKSISKLNFNQTYILSRNNFCSSSVRN